MDNDYSDQNEDQNSVYQKDEKKQMLVWMNEKIEETYISVNQDSRDCNFSNKWLKK